MALSFGVSWLCALLFWACLCFLPQTGCSAAHGFSLKEDESSSYAGDVLDPQTSTQFASGANQEFVSPRAETQDLWHQGEAGIHVGSVTGLGEDELVQSEPDSQQTGSIPPPFLLKYEQVSSDNRHPFGLLVSDHKPKKAVDGVSFPTIRDLKKFIESMKSSYLIPGSDSSRPSQTAQQAGVTGAELAASGAQNIKGKSSDSVEEGSGSETEPVSSVFEQSKHDASYKMPSESLRVTYTNQDFGPGSAPYTSPQQAATHAANHYRRPDRKHEDVQSTNYMRPEQIPLSSGSLYDEDLSFRVTAAPLEPPAASDLSYFPSEISNKTPLTSEQETQQPTFTSHSTDSQNPSDGSELGEKRLSSYAKGFNVPAPRGRRPSSDHLPARWERTAPLIQRPQPTVGKESKDLNRGEPAVHLPVSVSVSSSFNLLSPRSSSGHVGVQASSPQKPDLPEQALLSAAIQQPKHTTENNPLPVSSGLAVSFNSLTNLAPTSNSNVFSRLVGDMSRNLETQNLISDKFPTSRFAARKSDVFPTTLRQDVFLNEGESAPRAGLPRSFIQTTKEQKHPAKVNKKSLNLPPTSKVSGSTLSGVLRRSDGNRKSPLQTGPDMPPTSANTYIQSRGSYVRSKVSRSKSLYTPHLLHEGEAGTSGNLPDDNKL